MARVSLTAQQRTQQGMTLVEVLIAAIIVAVGLLGVVSMQVNALQGSTNADYRTKAIDFATSLSDRMQANLIAVADNDFLQPPSCAPDSASAISNCAMTPAMSSSASITNCTPRQMARYDLYQLSCGSGIQNSLPGGLLQITCVDADLTDMDLCSDLSPMLITISWQRQSRVTDRVADDVDQIQMTVIPGEP